MALLFGEASTDWEACRPGTSEGSASCALGNEAKGQLTHKKERQVMPANRPLPLYDAILVFWV